MTILMFYFGAFVLLCLGALCTRNTSALTGLGGAKYEAMQSRRLIGIILMVGAGVSLIIGFITQISGNPSPASSLATSNSAVPPSIAPVATSLPQGFQISTNVVEVHSPLTNSSAGQPPVSDLLLRAEQLVKQNKPDVALDQVNVAILASPQNPAAYALRGDIYVAKNLLDRAEKDYQTAIQFDSHSAQLKFNLAEIEFAQKKYGAARSGFAVLQQDENLGDLANYKVFLCDMFGGNESVAAKELDAFNQVGSNASYYFANAAWSLYHQKREDARDWLVRAGYIYPPYKFKLYADSLKGLSNPAK